METNPKINDFAPEPVYECHGHILFENEIDKTVSDIKKEMDHFNAEKFMVLAVPTYDDETENCKAFYCKEKLSPNVYASAGLHHYFDERDSADYYLSQIKKYHAMGCDGIKMIEGKMGIHRKLKTGYLDGEVFDKFYAYAEENSIPILIHLGDPESFWDITKASKYAIEQGWVCSKDDPSREDLRREISNVLKKFPKLRLILAHFYFMADDLERAGELFDTYENLCFDLTPGADMFFDFSKNPDASKAFFIKYQDRLLYGTDTYNYAPDGMDIEEKVSGVRVNQLRSFLEKEEPFYIKELSPDPVIPLNLSSDILEKIYRTNFTRIYGQMPRKVDYDLVRKECERVTTECQLNETMKRNMDVITKFFSK